MEKIIATWRKIVLCFDHFAVRKESETFYGVYEYNRIDKKIFGDVITSGATLHAATTKAKLLERGYRMCLSDNVNLY